MDLLTAWQSPTDALLSARVVSIDWVDGGGSKGTKTKSRFSPSQKLLTLYNWDNEIFHKWFGYTRHVIDFLGYFRWNCFHRGLSLSVTPLWTLNCKNEVFTVLLQFWLDLRNFFTFSSLYDILSVAHFWPRFCRVAGDCGLRLTRSAPFNVKFSVC